MAGFVCSDRKLKGRCGTPGYVAPDILRAGKKDSYPLNVDMFSIGVVAYSLLCGNEPFYDDDSAVLMENNKQALYDFSSPRWDRVSCHARDFVERALADKAETRINAEESKRHPWLKEFFA
eukprot:gene41796-51778_t